MATAPDETVVQVGARFVRRPGALRAKKGRRCAARAQLVRKEKHKEVEVRRRKRIADLFTKLSEVLGCGPTDKASILIYALSALAPQQQQQSRGASGAAGPGARALPDSDKEPAFTVFDAQSGSFSTSRAFLQLMGAAERPAPSLEHLLHLDDRAPFVAALYKCAADGAGFTREVRSIGHGRMQVAVSRTQSEDRSRTLLWMLWTASAAQSSVPEAAPSGARR
jgi:hypothetical protein